MVSPIINMPNTEKHSGISGIPTQLLVLHSGESPLRGGFAQSLTQWGNIPLNQGGPEASWHWFVDPIAIVSMVNPIYSAWHASEANPMSEGFEQAGYARFSRAEWTTPEGMKQLDNLAWLMAQRALANNIPPVWLPTDQITAVTTYGNRSIRGFATHRQIDPETRTDPGDGYPYDLLMDRIKAYMAGQTPAESQEEYDMAAPTAKEIAQAVLREPAFDGGPQFSAVIKALYDHDFNGGKSMPGGLPLKDYIAYKLPGQIAEALAPALAKISGGTSVSKEEISAIIHDAFEESVGELKATVTVEADSK
jgi:hypothetical protein